MDVILQISERTAEKAKAAANAQGKTVQEWIEEMIEQQFDEPDNYDEVREFMLKELAPRQGETRKSGGWKFNRDEINEERINQWNK